MQPEADKESRKSSQGYDHYFNRSYKGSVRSFKSLGKGIENSFSNYEMKPIISTKPTFETVRAL